MVETVLQGLTSEQRGEIQRQFLRARFRGVDALITEKTLEHDGRKRKRVAKDAVAAGLLVPTNVTSSNGMTYRITEVAAAMPPVKIDLFETWEASNKANPHRDAYERPWIRVDDQPVEIQCALLNTEGLDWFVVSPFPYDYHHASFADEPESIIKDGRPSELFHRYWAGPFPTLDEAITQRRAISGATVAASSNLLRQQVTEFFSDRRFQRTFASNLLWGLVDVAQVPNDLLFNADGKPTVDKQLDEGHSLRFESNPNAPGCRQDVRWETNLAKSIERLKSRITNAEQQLEKLRVIEARVQSCGGWGAFMDAMEQRLRIELSKERDTNKST